jgi:hypothetical protein
VVGVLMNVKRRKHIVAVIEDIYAMTAYVRVY